MAISDETSSDTCYPHWWSLAIDGETATCEKCNATRTIDSSQAWFWTPAWQAGERQADNELRRGEYETFDTMDDMLAALEGGER